MGRAWRHPEALHRQFADRKHYMSDLFNHYLYNITPDPEHFLKVHGVHSVTLKLCTSSLPTGGTPPVGKLVVRAQLVLSLTFLRLEWP